MISQYVCTPESADAGPRVKGPGHQDHNAGTSGPEIAPLSGSHRQRKKKKISSKIIIYMQCFGSGSGKKRNRMKNKSNILIK